MTAKPRLLAINNYHYLRGGAETVFFHHMDLFSRAGWDVVPFAMKHAENLPSPWSEHFVEEIEYGRDLGPARKAVQAAKIVYSLEARRKIADLVRLRPPALAHAHNVYHHLSPSIFGALKGAGVPIVLTAHDLKLACPAYKMLSRDGVCERCRGGKIHNVLLNRCVKGSIPLSGLVLLETAVHRTFGLYSRTVDRIVAPSLFYRDKLATWGWDRERIVHVPNCIDADRFVPAPHEGDYFAYAGRLAPEKGIGTLVRAAAACGRRVVIAGTGPEEQALRRLATELGADVAFAGHLSSAGLHRLVGQALALVLPSEWYENAPMSVLEAYALGRPVIGADIGGIPELIRPGETGALTRSGDVASLAEAMTRMAERSSTARARLGAAGRAWVERDFSPGAYLDRMSDLYASLGARP